MIGVLITRPALWLSNTIINHLINNIANTICSLRFDDPNCFQKQQKCNQQKPLLFPGVFQRCRRKGGLKRSPRKKGVLMHFLYIALTRLPSGLPSLIIQPLQLYYLQSGANCCECSLSFFCGFSSTKPLQVSAYCNSRVRGSSR